jgi:hypothetical protein
MGGGEHDLSYYFKCMVGGILACGVTHTAICPIDIVKCRKQVLDIHDLASVASLLLRLIQICISPSVTVLRLLRPNRVSVV